MRTRNNYTPEFKTKIVLEILSEVETVNQIAAKYEISPVANMCVFEGSCDVCAGYKVVGQTTLSHSLF
jgi:transposase